MLEMNTKKYLIIILPEQQAGGVPVCPLRPVCDDHPLRAAGLGGHLFHTQVP